MTAEFWAPMGWVGPAGIAARARQVETDGWDGMRVFDTQCLQGEAFVMMTASAIATSTLKLSIATSNPVTRHPSVAASAIASLACIAPGRIAYGVGRGDSSLAYVGGAPAKLALFERYVQAVRSYLHGESVDFTSIEPWRLTEDISAIEMGHAPDGSRLTWLDPLATPPDIEVFATGPKVLAVAGRLADRVCLGLGADSGSNRLGNRHGPSRPLRRRARPDVTVRGCPRVCRHWRRPGSSPSVGVQHGRLGSEVRDHQWVGSRPGVERARSGLPSDWEIIRYAAAWGAGRSSRRSHRRVCGLIRHHRIFPTMRRAHRGVTRPWRQFVHAGSATW